ncbi:MAG: DNA polymerase III subunit delta [Lentisphaeria bacterium]|nr:DNA polymerase III subunit delta [Candidatus Neomarinimicrobiota bacterium]MCF7841333.1 DNA polymerase III subunit delta [Lentisphaeria bacterium]
MADSSFDKFTKITAQVRSGALEPAYLVLGSDTFFVSLFIKLVKATYQQKFGGNGDITQLDGNEVKKRDDLEAYLSGGGLFSSASLIILQNVNSLDAGSRKLLQQVVSQGNPDMFFLITHPESSRSKRVPQWVLRFAENGQIVPADTPYENEIPRLVHRFAEIRGKKIQPRAVELLMQLTSNDLALIEHEMEKLSLFLGEDAEMITVDVVQDCIAAVSHATVLNLYDAISERNAAQAIKAFHEIFSRDDSIPYVIISIYTHLNKILGFTDHRTFPDVSTAATIASSGSRFYQQKIFKASRQFSQDELEAALCDLADIDYQFRQASIPSMSYFTTWVANHLV